LFPCNVYKFIPWFVFESSIKIKLSDPRDVETNWGEKKERKKEKDYFGNHQALQLMLWLM